MRCYIYCYRATVAIYMNGCSMTYATDHRNKFVVLLYFWENIQIIIFKPILHFLRLKAKFVSELEVWFLVQ